MATKAGIWLRVSSGAQDEKNQEPDVLQHCEQRGYIITRRYELNDRSAFKGEQDKKLEEMLHDMRTGEIDVLVFWYNDRLERRGAEALLRDLREIRDAGGRAESVREPELGKPDMAGEAATALAGVISHQDSVKKSDNVKLAVRRVRANGAVWGTLPWGYESVGAKYSKTGWPTAQGKKYIPEMFQRTADGETLSEIAAWLRAGPLPNIAPKTVLRMIRNQTYMGILTDREGRRVGKVTPLVKASLWKAANDRLDNASRARRGASGGQSALLTSALFCPRCPRNGKFAPMYRKHAHGPYYYYRCHGHLPEQKGCGNMVALQNTDFFVTQLLSQAPDDWTELRRTNGDKHEDDLADIRLALTELPKQGLSREGEQAERERLWALEDETLALIESAGKQPKWRIVPICGTCGGSEYLDTCETAGHHKVTVGEHFSSLDYDGQRALIVKEVKVYAQSITDPALRKITPGPMVRIESRLFTVPVEWVNN